MGLERRKRFLQRDINNTKSKAFRRDSVEYSVLHHRVLDFVPIFAIYLSACNFRHV